MTPAILLADATHQAADTTVAAASIALAAIARGCATYAGDGQLGGELQQELLDDGRDELAHVVGVERVLHPRKTWALALGHDRAELLVGRVGQQVAQPLWLADESAGDALERGQHVLFADPIGVGLGESAVDAGHQRLAVDERGQGLPGEGGEGERDELAALRAVGGTQQRLHLLSLRLRHARNVRRKGVRVNADGKVTL
jgi:hypothetical protein